MVTLSSKLSWDFVTLQEITEDFFSHFGFLFYVRENVFPGPDPGSLLLQ